MHLTTSFYRRLFTSLSLLLCLIACDSPPAEKADKNSTPRPVKLLELKYANKIGFLAHPALIHSEQLRELSFEQSGVIENLLVVEGQRVKQGDILAQLDQHNINDKLRSARAEFNNLDDNYKRAQRLISEGAISRSELKQRKSQRDISRAQLSSAEKALKDTTLIAPYNGHIATVSLKKHQSVQAGNTVISLLGQGGLQAKINVPAHIIARAKNKKVQNRGNYLTLAASPTTQIPIHFKEISLEADTLSQTYEVRFSFEAPAELIVLPGMAATLWLKDNKINSDSQTIKIPLSAIFKEAETHYVWLLNKDDMSVVKQPIKIAPAVGAQLTILSGLSVGDSIVISGVSYLSAGMKVRAWSINSTPH
ncbi:hypothetical protein A9Q82_01785 [Cycloclasticus sp. 46_120_T64]|nr:hypothetical protein A9Q82_01785 [Cycloclasticus sp. 46_120_T64]